MKKTIKALAFFGLISFFFVAFSYESTIKKRAIVKSINGYLCVEFDSCQGDAYYGSATYYIDTASNVYLFYLIDEFDSATLNSESKNNARIANFINELHQGKKVSQKAINYLLSNYVGCCGGSSITGGLMKQATKKDFYYSTSFFSDANSNRPAKLFVFYKIDGLGFHFSGKTSDYWTTVKDTTIFPVFPTKSLEKSYFENKKDNQSFWGLYKYNSIYPCDSIVGFPFLKKYPNSKFKLAVFQ